jgi:mRNA-degrading endonuclease HigB of HigAB toxin-antitoxin module
MRITVDKCIFTIGGAAIRLIEAIWFIETIWFITTVSGYTSVFP